MYIIMFHAFPFHTLEALTAGSLEATAITHERKGPSDLPTKPPSIMVHVNLQGNVWLHEFAHRTGIPRLRRVPRPSSKR